MHVRVRTFGKPDVVVVVDSKLTKIDQFRRIIKDKFDVEPKLQQLFYGGKLLEDGYTFYDYNIKLNEVIQLVVKLKTEETTEKNKLGNGIKKEDETKEIKNYKDASSPLYLIGDLVDMRDQVHGTWLEGKIVGIFYDPDSPIPVTSSPEKSNEENKSPNKKKNGVNEVSPSKSKKKCITDYFNRSPKRDTKETEVKLLYKVQLDDEEESNYCCEEHNIRPRARTVINVENLKEGQKVMINYNIDEPLEKGYWYDFKVDKVKKLRKTYELSGTLYLGADALPQNDTKVKVLDKIFAIEEVIPVAQRTAEQQKKLLVIPEKRSTPLKCLTCRDDEDKPCQDCGCYMCHGKEKPDKIVLCDDCDNGYHMDCLDPPLNELPDDEWYCPSCKLDPNEVVAPGAAKQKKKSNASKSKRDWGRGMACVGKTKSSTMPANHFGPIPGIEVGMCWRFRIQLSETGVHRPPVSGIHGRDVEGAYSIVLSGGYEDDVDNGNEFTYTGSGGRDLSGNKRTAEQSCDQTLTRENKALARNCSVSQISEKGGDAGDNWRNGKPVRVVRSYKMQKHFPKYAPKEGIRYDGIYKVVKYYPEKGLSGYRVWKYLLRRDDPSPAPWQPNATQYPIIYPDGYLEAEAEKKAQKQKGNRNGKGNKRVLGKRNTSESDSEPSPPTKKKKTASKAETQTKISDTFSKDKNGSLSPKKSPKKLPKNDVESTLSPNAKKAIKADKLNCKLWDESLKVLEEEGKKKFLEHIAEVFLCIICQGVAICPVTTPCLHNFCMACITLAFKTTGSQTCPCCRERLSKNNLQPNDQLKAALQTIMAGYDAGK